MLHGHANRIVVFKKIADVISMCQNVSDFACSLILAVNGRTCHDYLRSLVDRAPTLCLRAHGFGGSDVCLWHLTLT